MSNEEVLWDEQQEIVIEEQTKGKVMGEVKDFYFAVGEKEHSLCPLVLLVGGARMMGNSGLK
jgi:hypothetical protein